MGISIKLSESSLCQRKFYYTCSLGFIVEYNQHGLSANWNTNVYSQLNWQGSCSLFLQAAIQVLCLFFFFCLKCKNGQVKRITKLKHLIDKNDLSTQIAFILIYVTSIETGEEEIEVYVQLYTLIHPRTPSIKTACSLESDSWIFLA